MTRSAFLLLLLICCIVPAASAQNSYQIQGKIVDSISGDHLELVSVLLKNPLSPTAQYVQLSDSSGKFQFDKVKAGRYDLRLSFIGYRTKTLPVTVNKDADLGSIRLSTSTQALSEATVVGQKQIMTRTSEKTVFNVALSPTHQTGTAEDALRNMPGVTIDRNGNISMVGKQGVKVLVDGKPSVLAEANLQAFLKSIPANTIESIELITNPSARYEANGNAGIINIKLKKGKRQGLNGSASASYGFPDRYAANTVINYRKDKINLFATYSMNYKKEKHEFIDKRDITLNDTLTHYYQDNPSYDRNLSNTLKAGLDYFINDKNSITYTFSGSHNWSRTSGTSTGQNMAADFNLIDTYLSGNTNNGINLSITNDINYQKKYDSTDRELLIDFSHTYVSSNSTNNLVSNAYDTAGNLIPGQSLTRSMLPRNNINNFIFQLNYTEPLKIAGAKLETGMKNETTINKNSYDVFDSQNGTSEKNILLSNGFSYLENIAAFYMIYSGAYKEWLSYSGGIRSEYTYINSDYSNVNKSYLSLFPSGTISTNLSKTQNLSISYSRRVQRPEFRQINNSIIYFDQYSTWQGNPYLNPAFSNILSLAYSANIKKTMISLSSENTFTTGEFSESAAVDSLRITRGSIRNGGKSRIVGGSFYIKTELTKWWTVQMNHFVAWEKFDYEPNVNNGPIAGSYYNLWMSTDFKFWKNMVFNMNGWFNTGDLFPQGKSKAVGVLNASLKKDFLKDKLSVSIVGQNLLNSMRFQWYVNNSGLHTNGSWQNFSRAVILTLTYRFGKENKNISRKDLEENSRLGGGGGGKGK